MQKILVTGARGYLGAQFLQHFEASPCEVDIADEAAVESALGEARPDVVINCAGKTGRPNVDWCERHRLETLRSNVTGALVLASVCLQNKIRLVHLSTGCVYTGDHGGAGFSETDLPNFLGSYYSRTKYLAEQALREFPVLILRPRMPFDATRHPRSLINKLKRYTRVLDAPNSLTNVEDLLSATEQLLEAGAVGVFNVVNPGRLSPFQIAERYRDMVDPGLQFERLTVEQLTEVAATGRSNCVLDISKLQQQGVRMRPVADALTDALQRLAAEAP